jgi:RNA-directed DNA polymerase
MDNGLYDSLAGSFIYDNFACQPGKGLTNAMCRVGTHLKRHFEEHGMSNMGYYAQLDIRHYFDSTPHGKLKEFVKAKV